MKLERLIKNARLSNGKLVHIGIIDDKIAMVTEAQSSEAKQRIALLDKAIQEIDAQGFLVSRPFVDAHFHLDATLSLGYPRFNESGTLLEGIQIWAEQKPDLQAELMKDRVTRYLKWAISKGTLAIRSHVDICDPSLLAVRVLKEIQAEFRPYIDIELVAFPQDGYLRDPNAFRQLEEALKLGVEVIGGIPHFERTQQQGRESIERLCAIAARLGKKIDMHCDENDDPQSKNIEILAEQTIKYQLQGQVTASHVTSMHSMDNDYVYKLLSLIHEAKLHIVANPLINITLQGRQDTYPKRRGMTRVKELMQKQINVAFGHDCVMDPWYALGSGDMLEVASMGLHVGQLTGLEQMKACFDAVTINPAKILGLETEIKENQSADLVILGARDAIEAIRLRANRLYVMRKGKIIAQSPLAQSQLSLFGKNPESINWMDGVPSYVKAEKL